MVLKVRVKPKLPTRLQGRNGFTVSKSGGVYTVEPDYGSLAAIASVTAAETDNIFVPTYRDDGTPINGRISLDVLIDVVAAGLDATLISIAALTPGANQSIYFTATDTAALYTLTAAARNLLDDATAGDMLTTLGVSSFMQTVLDDTTAGAALTTLGFSTFIKTLIDDTDGPTALTTLGAVPLAGGTMTGALILSADPATGLGAATKQYVDTVAQGLDAKPSVLCATTANITLSGEQTLDGVLTAASRVLVKNQSTASQNGLYVSAAGAWARATDADAWAELPSAFVFVEQGTLYADTGWVCTAEVGGTLGSTSVTWAQFSGAGTYTAGTGLSLTGTQFAINDAELLAIAGLTSAANKLAYFTGSGTAALADFTSAGRALVDDADASAQRATLGVVIGTDVQAFHARLADLAGITYAQGDVLYYNGSNLVKLAAGTSGHFLKTQGAAANPLWAAVPGGGDLLASNNLSDLLSAATARTNLGLAYGKQTLWIPAGAMKPRITNGAVIANTETTTNKVQINGLDFDASTNQFAQFGVWMPKSYDAGTITAVFVWEHPATTTNFAVVWGIQGFALGDNAALDTAFGTAQEVTDTGGTTNNEYVSGETSAVTIANTPAGEKMAWFQVYRNAASGSDTLAVNARLLGVRIYFTANAANDT